jgi:hypothetical protein
LSKACKDISAAKYIIATSITGGMITQPSAAIHSSTLSLLEKKNLRKMNTTKDIVMYPRKYIISYFCHLSFQEEK